MGLLKYLFSVFSFLFLLWGMGLLWFITQIPTHPTDNEQTTDAIVVLTGGSLRLEHGFELLVQGRAKKMFISGVKDGLSLSSLLKSKEYHMFADHIPQGSVELGYKARSTSGNAEETTQWMAAQHVNSIRLVTGNYHIPRGVYELHQAAPEVLIIPDPVFQKHFGPHEWWLWSDSIRLVLSEYNKYMASVVGHKLLAMTW